MKKFNNILKPLVLITTLLLASMLTACSDDSVDTSPDLSNSEIVATPDLDNKDDELVTPDIDQTQEDINQNSFGNFTATTLAGDELSNDIFEDYELTMVNIWATWCSPCVKEMPDLQELHTILPDNMNLITICSDADTQLNLANEILADAVATHNSDTTFDTIIANDEVNANILSRIAAFPTSVFVDSDGNVVHAVEGAPSGDNIAGIYLGLMEELLAYTKGELNADGTEGTENEDISA